MLLNRIWIPRICIILDLLNPYLDPSLFAQILPSSSNNIKKIHDFYCFVTSLWLFIYLQKVRSKNMKEIFFFVKVTDEKSRIQSKIWIRIRKSAVRICRSGSWSISVPKCQRSTTLVTDEGSDQGITWKLGTFDERTFWHGEQASPGKPRHPIPSSHAADKRGTRTPKGETAEHFPPLCVW